MRQLQPWALFASLIAVPACHHEEVGPPTSVEIAPVTVDAVYVVNGETHSISVIDATTHQPINAIALEGIAFPHHISMNAARSRLLLGAIGEDVSGGHHKRTPRHADEPGGGAVLLLDAATGSMVASRRLAAPNHNALWSRDESEIWTAQGTAPGTVLVLDPGSLETLATIEVGDDPLEVTFGPDGTRAFVANHGSDTVSVIDVASRTVLATVPVGDGPVGAWPGADGNMYVDNETARSLSVIDPTSMQVARTLELGFTPAIAAIAPGGELWVADPDAGQIVFLDAATGTPAGTLATAAGAHGLVFADDGATAWVTNQLAGSVSVIDVAGKTVTTTVTVGAKPNGLLFRAAP